MSTPKQHAGESDVDFYNRTGRTFAPAACFVINTRRGWLTDNGRATLDPTRNAPATFSTKAAAEAFRLKVAPKNWNTWVTDATDGL